MNLAASTLIRWMADAYRALGRMRDPSMARAASKSSRDRRGRMRRTAGRRRSTPSPTSSPADNDDQPQASISIASNNGVWFANGDTSPSPHSACGAITGHRVTPGVMPVRLFVADAPTGSAHRAACDHLQSTMRHHRYALVRFYLTAIQRRRAEAATSPRSPVKGVIRMQHL